MELCLKGKNALVTGSSRGLGRYIALRLAQEGCNVMLCSRNSGELKEVKNQCKGLEGKVAYLKVDLGLRGSSSKAVAQTVKEFGGIDILVNNVGGNRRKPFVETSDQDWDELMDLNFRGPLEATREAVKNMKMNSGGSVLFISSIFGREFGGKDMTLYHVSKSALISLSKSLAIELAEDDIRVNTIAPGSILFEGGSWDKRQKNNPEIIDEFINQNLPMKRFGKADEIADAAVYLVSPRASLVTGTCWNVDGGQSKTMI